MKFFLAALPAFVLAENLTFQSLTGSAILGFTQLGNGTLCLDIDTNDGVALKETGGEMDFLSDSLEMCAIACNCRQSCISFNWVKPDTFDGELRFVLALNTSDVGDQGKCTLRSSDCEGDFATSVGAAPNEYAFQRTNQIATDVSATYPRSGAAGESKVTNQVTCVLQTVTAADGFRAIGHGGPGAGICASGGRYAKLTDMDAQAPAETGLAACKTLCAGNSACSLFNLLPDGSCKFRKQCCQTFWSAETAKKGWTSYAKESCAAADSGTSDGNSDTTDPGPNGNSNTTDPGLNSGSRARELGLVAFSLATAIHFSY